MSGQTGLQANKSSAQEQERNDGVISQVSNVASQTANTATNLLKQTGAGVFDIAQGAAGAVRNTLGFNSTGNAPNVGSNQSSYGGNTASTGSYGGNTASTGSYGGYTASTGSYGGGNAASTGNYGGGNIASTDTYGGNIASAGSYGTGSTASAGKYGGGTADTDSYGGSTASARNFGGGTTRTDDFTSGGGALTSGHNSERFDSNPAPIPDNYRPDLC